MKYQAIFTRETKPNQILGKKGVFIVSLTLYEEQPDSQDKIDKFSAGIERLQTASDSLDFVSTDLLNRHNFEIISGDEDENKKKSLNNYEFWKVKNFDQVKNLKNLNEIFSWGELLSKEDYGFCFEFVSNLYENDIEFKRRVCKTAALRFDFLMTDLNKNKINLPFSPEVIVKKSIDYIMEECAMVILFRHLKYDSLFYLGKISLPIEYVSELEHTDPFFNLINTINLFQISQYKPVNDNQELVTKKVRKRNKYSPTVVDTEHFSVKKTHKLNPEKNSQGEDSQVLRLAYQTFFDSPTIPISDKTNTLLRLSFFQKSKTPESCKLESPHLESTII